MGNLSNRAIHSIFGCPTQVNTTTVDFSSTAAVTELEPNEIYRLAPSEDCYIDFDNSGSVTAVDSDGVLLFAGVPEMFSTTTHNYFLAVIRKAYDGELVITKMTTRGN